MNTLFRSLIAVVLVCCGSLAIGQEIGVDELPRPEFRGLTQKQLSRLVFSNEQAMITKLSSLPLVTEAYVQSLGHHQSKGMDLTLDESSDSVIDDVYFLARADFNRELPVQGLLAGGGPWRNRYIEINSGALEQVYPNGLVGMLFVDFNSFDADTYSLIYEGKVSLANTECLEFTVVPAKERESGRFRGQIWVDSSSLSIVRIKGALIGPPKHWDKLLAGPFRYFHFDSWREKINNRWVPSSMYFDERHAFHTDGNLEFHYRGYALLWQQHEEPADGPLLNNMARGGENESIFSGPSRSFPQNTLLARLESDGLLAARGQEEQRLDRIIQKIAPASEAGIHKIDCRVLVTTPAEIFAVGDTIVVSRGLLNLVPDDSVLAFLLARQAAHILLGHKGGDAQPFSNSLFDLAGKKKFAGLGIRWTANEEAAADSKAIALLNESPYESGIGEARFFLSQLESESHRFPNLVRARFGTGIIPEGGGLAMKQEGPMTQHDELRFENRYRVSWNRVIVDSQEEGAQAESKPPGKEIVVQTSVMK